MNFEYPVVLKRDDNETFLVTCPDIPELVTFGDDREDALRHAQNALITALEMYQDDRRDLPKPSAPKKGRPIVSPPPRVLLKASLYQAMRDAEISNVELAARLGRDEKQIRRLLNFNVDSRVTEIARALEEVGLELTAQKPRKRAAA